MFRRSYLPGNATRRIGCVAPRASRRQATTKNVLRSSEQQSVRLIGNSRQRQVVGPLRNRSIRGIQRCVRNFDAELYRRIRAAVRAYVADILSKALIHVVGGIEGVWTYRKREHIS